MGKPSTGGCYAIAVMVGDLHDRRRRPGRLRREGRGKGWRQAPTRRRRLLTRDIESSGGFPHWDSNGGFPHWGFCLFGVGFPHRNLVFFPTGFPFPGGGSNRSARGPRGLLGLPYGVDALPLVRWVRAVDR